MKEFTLNLGRARGRRTLDKVEGFSTVIGEDSHFVGQIGGKGHCIVHGKVDGDCDIEGTIVIGESGRWIGDIKAGCILIAGSVDGDVQASDKMEIVSTARVKGKITSSILAIAEGAVHVGVVQMPQKSDITRFNDKRVEEGEIDTATNLEQRHG